MAKRASGLKVCEPQAEAVDLFLHRHQAPKSFTQVFFFFYYRELTADPALAMYISLVRIISVFLYSQFEH